MLSLSILVLLHEGGHFFFSKLFGVKRSGEFYLFLTLVPSLQFSQRIRILPMVWDGLPLGLLKISGMNR